MVKQVLIAVDGSPQARLALKVARAHYPQAHRRLIRVVDDRVLALDADSRTARAAALSAAQDTLQAQVRPGESSEVMVGEPVQVLLQAAESFGAEVLVIGTHGRRGMGRLMLGSVAEEVARRAEMPVLIVHEASLADATDQVADPATHPAAEEDHAPLVN
jgi:nucleotide-binding universal stress UspA family protein